MVGRPPANSTPVSAETTAIIDREEVVHLLQGERRGISSCRLPGRAPLHVIPVYDPLPPSIRTGVRDGAVEDRVVSVRSLVVLGTRHQAKQRFHGEALRVRQPARVVFKGCAFAGALPVVAEVTDRTILFADVHGDRAFHRAGSPLRGRIRSGSRASSRASPSSSRAESAISAKGVPRPTTIRAVP